MKREALGLIETRGYVGAVAAADAMLKTADVALDSRVIVGGNLSVVAVRGDVSAVRAAVDAGKAAASRVGELVSAHVIAREHEETGILLPPLAPGGAPSPAPARGRSRGRRQQ